MTDQQHPACSRRQRVLHDTYKGYAKLGNFEIFDKLSQFPTTGARSSPIEDPDWRRGFDWRTPDNVVAEETGPHFSGSCPRLSTVCQAVRPGRHRPGPAP